MHCQIIAIYNNKGGAAKTVTAVNLAAIWAAEGKRILLIDLDAQANATSYLGCAGQEPTVGDMLRGRCSLDQAICQSRWSHLDLIPAQPGLSEDLAFLRLDELGVPQQLLRNAVVESELDYDYILLDCPPAIDLATANALALADWLLLPCTADDFALQGVARTLQALRRANRGRQGRALELLRLVICNRGREKLIQEHNIREIEKSGLPLAQTQIRRSKYVPESLTEQRPLVHYAKQSQPCTDYQALARELAELLEASVESGAAGPEALAKC